MGSESLMSNLAKGVVYYWNVVVLSKQCSNVQTVLVYMYLSELQIYKHNPLPSIKQIETWRPILILTEVEKLYLNIFIKNNIHLNQHYSFLIIFSVVLA